MAQYWPKGAGPNFVPAYQISGVPYVTSSLSSDLTTTPVQIDFPYATRFFVVNKNWIYTKWYNGKWDRKC